MFFFLYTYIYVSIQNDQQNEICLDRWSSWLDLSVDWPLFRFLILNETRRKFYGYENGLGLPGVNPPPPLHDMLIAAEKCIS